MIMMTHSISCKLVNAYFVVLTMHAINSTLTYCFVFLITVTTLNTYRTAVSPTLDLLCHEDFNVGRSEAESNIEIFMAQ